MLQIKIELISLMSMVYKEKVVCFLQHLFNELIYIFGRNS